jgi:hypothetical protein
MTCAIDKIKLTLWNRLCRANYNLFYKKLFIARLCSFDSITPKPKRGFIAGIADIMKHYNIDFFMREFILNREVPPQRNWKRFIGNVIQTASEQKWRSALMTRKELNRYAETHENLTIHPLWSLGLRHPKYTWKLGMVIKLSTEVEKKGMVCKLCSRITSDIAAHFILDCPRLYSSRDRMMDEIVNVLNVQNYVDLTNLDDNEILNSILGSKRHVVIPDDEWETFMTAVVCHK